MEQLLSFGNVVEVRATSAGTGNQNSSLHEGGILIRCTTSKHSHLPNLGILRHANDPGSLIPQTSLKII
ncbi:hypothetical protein E4T56_gene14521 [Termitomyces sp. T112]|nr:hypothetical protein E4T56_gene14521 [Termitomyces sp. T112]